MHPIWEQEAAADDARARAIVMSAGDDHWDLGLSVVQTLVGLVPAGGTVCDLGCGMGRLLVPVSRSRDDVWFVGIDGSVSMLFRCQDALGERAVDLVQADVTEVAEYGPFDLIYSTLVLHHLDQAVQEQVIGEAARSLRPGGYLAFIVVVPSGRPDDEGPLSHPVRIEDVCDWIRTADLMVESVGPIDGFPTLRWVHARKG